MFCRVVFGFLVSFCFILGTRCYANDSTAESCDLASVLMHATYLIGGPAKDDPAKSKLGTIFVMGRPIRGEDASKVGCRCFFILVTAAHVLKDIAGDYATVNFRSKDGSGEWIKRPVTLRIRDKGSNLYVVHPTEDVAAMHLTVGLNESDARSLKSIPLVSTELLVTDEKFRQLKLGPGSVVNCLGFPLGLTMSEAGFPILRGGMIASYPLTPFATTKSFAYDFEIYPGNSGGPVYFYSPGYESTGEIFKLKKDPGFAVLGLVTQQLSAESTKERIELKIGRVVTAPVIRETIDMLPELKLIE